MRTQCAIASSKNLAEASRPVMRPVEIIDTVVVPNGSKLLGIKP